jgi:cytohesin
MLLERGANVNAQEEDESTPLHPVSFRCHWHPELVRTLLEHGADVSVRNNLGLTPSLLASRSRNVEVIRIHLERGADVIAVRDRDEDGSTALHLALRWGRAAVACVLLERSVDGMARDRDAMTPLHLAAREERVEVVCVLLERGADANALMPVDPVCGWRWEADHGNVAHLFLRNGADAEAQVV